MWEKAGRDTAVAQTHLAAVVHEMTKSGMKISSPKSCLNVYLDRTRKPLPNGKAADETDYFALVLLAIANRTVKDLDPLTKQALNGIGGVTAVATRTPDKESFMRRNFNALRSSLANGLPERTH
jgi:hypothetical protein